jgi:hypothetical protein
MMVLKGYFCKVNKYGRLKFRYIGGTEGTEKKLIDASISLGEHVREYAKKLILGIDESGSESGSESSSESGDKHPSKPHLPFDDRGYTVPKWIKKPPQDILGRVGMICTIEVKVMPYDFTSEAKHNRGEHVVGIQLMLVKVIKGEL